SRFFDVRLVLIVIGSSSLVLSMIVGFDFRSDVDRMDALKALPIPAPAMVVGELVVPVLLLTLAQGAFLVLAAGAPRDARYVFEALVFLPPYNALLVEVDAVLFLWFPFRLLPGSSMDFAIMGRQMLLMLTKTVAVGIAAGLAAGLGVFVYYLVISSWS